MPLELDFLTELKAALSKIGHQNEETIDDSGPSTQRTGGLVSDRTPPPLSCTTTTAAVTAAAGANCADTDAKDVAADAGSTRTVGHVFGNVTRELTTSGSDDQQRSLTRGKKVIGLTMT